MKAKTKHTYSRIKHTTKAKGITALFIPATWTQLYIFRAIEDQRMFVKENVLVNVNSLREKRYGNTYIYVNWKVTV